ncbi:MAG: hypothetical protein A3B31_03155 [Candidatus Komeilibacteria bacterium RIFCSPLOWO2_01_FULL_53_11]|uniref:Uncharacterized protein n=1 Tax=Candidatus Komeilibacteria bacterium RIFCSPLOWO2_01_FULL_53_11 TaxID=1798552 RepID=A0A1G2BPL8_9BACT|nr:MAG: hypothetical protein A3B31_03155 [Candidatus Komeilibacteria bacterium RIFCSPLOWO2_01_FULL_53_11]
MEALAWFAFGTLSFWLLVTVIALSIFYCVETRHNILGVWIIIVTLSLISYVGREPVWSTLFGSWKRTLLYVLGYVAAGITWSFFKWDRFAASERRRHDRLLAHFTDNLENYLAHQTRNGPAKPSPEQIVTMRAMLQSGIMPEQARPFWNIFSQGKHLQIPPLASHNMDRIVAWAMYWPWSLLWTFVRDFIVDLFENIVRWLRSAYQAIANRHFKDLKTNDESQDLDLD